MPSRPRPMCAVPACSCHAMAGSGYCAAHAKQQAKKPSDQRHSSWRRGYNGTWQQARARHMTTNPKCFRCGQPGRVVHHVRPLGDGGTHDRDNLMTLCFACHNREHPEKGGRR